MEKDTDWTKTFFSGFILETLPWWSTKEQTQQEADFLVRTLAPAPGARILDVPCGNGRLALALAERGFNLTGVDFTGPWVEYGRTSAAQGGLTAVFEQRDMRDLPWPAAFDHAFCFGNSFAYFDDPGNHAFLQAVHDTLKPGGKFVLQTNLAAESVLTQPLKPFWMKLGDQYFLHETRYNPAAGQLTSGYTSIRDGRVECKQAVYRVYPFRELQQMICAVGFTVLQSYGSLKQEPYQLGCEGLWLVAAKASP
jgi:SAM-dependent methyltransferase